MNINRIKLKIKSKSLAEEARIIRKEEQKLKQHSRNTIGIDYKREFRSAISCIKEHRTGIVRYESRATHLALAFLNNKPYKSIEKTRKPEKDYEFNAYVVPRVVAMVSKYSYGLYK